MRVLLSLGAAAALLLAPLTASAASPPLKTVKYVVSLHQIQPRASAGAKYTGYLTLRFYSGGLVNGFYRDEFSTRAKTVTGGLHGGKLWLSFGMNAKHQFDGMLEKDGRITGTLTHWPGPNVYELTARPGKP